MMTQGTLVDATIIEAPSSTRTKSSNAIRRCIRPRKAISGTLAKAHIGVDAKSGLDPAQPGHHRGQRGMTSISWVICCMERSNLSPADAGYQGRHSARSWPRWMWTG